jgi:hypothetical protein
LWCSKDFAQGQVLGEKSAQPQHAQLQDDIKVLVDPRLRLLVVEAVKIINVDWEIPRSRERQTKENERRIQLWEREITAAQRLVIDAQSLGVNSQLLVVDA